MLRWARSALAAPLIGLAVLGPVALLPASAASASTVVALWHMNNKTGTLLYDSSGHGNNGTTHNVTLGATGVSGNAYTFNGKSSYAEVPNSSSLNPGSANISISFYLKTTHLPKTGDYDLVRKGAYPGQDYKVELMPTGQIKCTFQGSASRHNATGGSGLNNGAWHHVQCIKTSSQIKTVIDGKVVATTTAAVGSISNTSAAEIGAHPGSDWYNGELDEVSIAFG
jgi:Concanavalin A-like lectin/glucanases superfamily